MVFILLLIWLVFFVFVVVVFFFGFVIVFDNFDGCLCFLGMKDKFSFIYGCKFEVMYENKVVDCIWYGWENVNYFFNVMSLCSR